MSDIIDDVRKFIDNNTDENIMKYYDKIYDNVVTMNKNLTQYLLFLGLTILAFYVVKNTSNTDLEIEFLKINDKGLLLKFIPITFSFLILRCVMTVSYRNKTTGVMDLLFFHLFAKEQEQHASNSTRMGSFIHHNQFFSALESLHDDKKSRIYRILTFCVGMFFILVPLVSEFIFINEIVVDFYSDPSTYITIALTLFFNFYSVYIFSKNH